MFYIIKQLTKNSNSSNWNYSIPQLLLLSLQIALSSRASGKRKFKNSKRLVAMVWRHKPVKFPSSLWQLVVNAFKKLPFFVQYLFLLRTMKSVFFFRYRIDCWHLEIGFHINVGKSGKVQFPRGRVQQWISSNFGGLNCCTLLQMLINLGHRSNGIFWMPRYVEGTLASSCQAAH